MADHAYEWHLMQGLYGINHTEKQNSSDADLAIQIIETIFLSQG